VNAPRASGEGARRSKLKRAAFSGRDTPGSKTSFAASLDLKNRTFYLTLNNTTTQYLFFHKTVSSVRMEITILSEMRHPAARLFTSPARGYRGRFA